MTWVHGRLGARANYPATACCIGTPLPRFARTIAQAIGGHTLFPTIRICAVFVRGFRTTTVTFLPFRRRVTL